MSEKITFSVSMDRGIREAAERAAKDDMRKLGPYIQKVLKDRLQDDGYLPPDPPAPKPRRKA